MWIQRYTLPGDEGTTWLIVNPDEKEIMGAVELSPDHEILDALGDLVLTGDGRTRCDARDRGYA